jgi:uncharacterized protein YndB with AHSA1/START domain
MGQGAVDEVLTIRAPIAKVFARFTDHEGMASWPGISGCRLVKEGMPRNGVGAVRRVKAGGGVTLDEEVVLYEEPTALDYTIIRGLPVKHRGQLRFAEVDGGVQVTWTVRMSSRVPLVAQVASYMLRRKLPKALAYLKEELEA